MEAACFSETPVNTCQSTRITTQKIAIFIASSFPQSKVGGLDQVPRSHRRENLKL
jgi:hypothetical protein